MTAIPQQNIMQAMIDAAHEAKSQEFRPHLGCSIAGHKCDRHIWLKFRWAFRPKFDGRILRLFRRGQNEEATVISDLQEIGLIINRTGDNQLTINFGGAQGGCASHVGGSLDGIIESGVPEAPKKRHVLEIKTHSLKSFNELDAKGVAASKPMHYVQMQLYMLETGIDRALYVAVCKDDDRLYFERVRLDKDFAGACLERAQHLSLFNELPRGISENPSWYECKMCEFHAFCHAGVGSIERNCRTCVKSIPEENGDWACSLYPSQSIPVEFQRSGCDQHWYMPELRHGACSEAPLSADDAPF